MARHVTRCRELPEVGLEPTLSCLNGILNPEEGFGKQRLAAKGAQIGNVLAAPIEMLDDDLAAGP